jgi:single-stranded-DNA-specific exonuclease
MTTLITQKHWRIFPPNPFLQAQLSDALDIHPLMAQLLINRALTTPEDAERFLRADLDRLHDPFQLKDMERAVSRIRAAGQRREKVLIVGDYDVDGVTSSALLVSVLREMGYDVENHIPHRLYDGYGLNAQMAELAQSLGAQLVITVDCGITASTEVALIKERGIDVIIIDHHEPPEEGIPEAYAIIDPKQKTCAYPFKELAAVGLVAKLITALFGRMDYEHLDLVALGTVADVVPLRGENRIFVKSGLPQIQETKKKGLAALMDISRMKKDGRLRPYAVGFILGPRINAAGRMGSAQTSLDLLLTDDHGRAYVLAQALEDCNAQRQRLQRMIIQEAVAEVDQNVNFKEHKVIVVGKEGWHKGVIGIVAARVAERYGRPAVVIAVENGWGTASARSIEGFHLHEALTYCAAMLENFGGHKQAAGLTIKEENIAAFTQLINRFAQGVMPVKDLIPQLVVDAEVPLSQMTMAFAHSLDCLEPFGEGNPAPAFAIRRLKVKGAPVVLGRDTLKLWLTDGVITVSAIGFGMARYRDFLYAGQRVDVAFELSIDDWRHPPEVQFKLKDIRESVE